MDKIEKGFRVDYHQKVEVIVEDKTESCLLLIL